MWLLLPGLCTAVRGLDSCVVSLDPHASLGALPTHSILTVST